MKRITFVVAVATMLASPFARAQNISVPSFSGQTQPAPQKQQKLVKVATINGPQAVHEFQHNVSVLQNELLAAKDLQAQLDKETDAKKKKELQTRLDAAMKKLDTDNATMTKTYGFSLTRNYVVDTDSITLYTAVSDEEAAKVEAAAKEQGNAKK